MHTFFKSNIVFKYLINLKLKLQIFFLLNVLYGQAYPVLKFKVDLTVNLLNTQPLKDSVLYLLLHKIATETLYTLYKNIIYNMNSWIFFVYLRNTSNLFYVYFIYTFLDIFDQCFLFYSRYITIVTIVTIVRYSTHNCSEKNRVPFMISK